jgi:hypothetical protein
MGLGLFIDVACGTTWQIKNAVGQMSVKV